MEGGISEERKQSIFTSLWVWKKSSDVSAVFWTQGVEANHNHIRKYQDILPPTGLEVSSGKAIGSRNSQGEECCLKSFQIDCGKIYTSKSRKKNSRCSRHRRDIGLVWATGKRGKEKYYLALHSIREITEQLSALSFNETIEWERKDTLRITINPYINTITENITFPSLSEEQCGRGRWKRCTRRKAEKRPF